LKAAVFLGPKRVKLLDVKKPTITSDEVLIKIRAAGICGSDLRFYLGKKGMLRNLLNRAITLVSPSKTIIGHEFSGFVVEKGKHVDNVEVNEKVTAWPIIPCHECRYCKMGLTNLCENIRPWPGAFSEFVKVPAENVIKIPVQSSYEEAAMLEPLACALHGIRLANIEKHHSVAILGAGTMGLLALQEIKSLGVKQTTIIDIVPFKLELAKKLGADISINCNEINSCEKERLCKDIDIVIECVGGSAAILNQASDLVKKRGKIVTFGTLTSPQKINLLKFRQKELTIMGSEGSEKQDFVNAINLLVSGRVKLKPLITHKFPLKNIKDAFKTASKRENKSIKIQIIP
jgi:2-desacetyl-2-hydroxyethyl bacteriochlorophyllide A dehydrogenase